ncbi:MAG: bifunctional DNA primase/polymerase [Anaerolineae bacterium]
MVASTPYSLFGTVSAAVARYGFACIPLEPDSKRPLHNFDLSAAFHQTPTHSQLRTWFTSATNYAVLCGSISNNLFVLDFDSHDAYHEFCAAFPSLAQSYTVQTRRGFHVYLRSAHSHLKSRKLRGGELQAHHSYVVGAGSIIQGTHYTITIDAPIITADEPTLKHLLQTLSIQTKTDQPHSHSPETKPTADASPKAALTALKLVQHYKTHALVAGRNNALYRAALIASYSGISQQTCIDTLATVHAHAAAIAQHLPETIEQRTQEALLTIKSAYKAQRITAAEPTRNAGKRSTTGLPNPLREILLHHGKTTTARLLDAFALAGWHTGKHFSMQDAIQSGSRFGISRSTVIKVVAQRAIFNSIENPPPPVRDSDKSIPYSNHSPKRGKPVTRCYLVPDYNKLAAYCGVSLDGCSTDKLSAHDLRSNKAYRMALHRAFVQRTSPELSMRFMAERLGVCERSLRRYNAALHVTRTPIFAYDALTWANIHEPDFWGEIRRDNGKQVAPGRWLQLEDGKRFPAVKGIALRLLAAGKTSAFCRRLPSRLTLGDDGVAVSPTPETNAPDVNLRRLPEAKANVPTPHVIWRHLRGECPDCCDSAYRLPPAFQQTPAPVSAPAPDDLSVIKGIGRSWARVLRKAGIDTYAKLASVTNFEGVAKLFFSPYLSARQVSFWVYQAQLLVQHAVTGDDLRGWRYRDWKDYQFELSRVRAGASERLKWKLAEEFIDFGWQKYKPTLPDWFAALLAQVQRSRLL